MPVSLSDVVHHQQVFGRTKSNFMGILLGKGGINAFKPKQNFKMWPHGKVGIKTMVTHRWRTQICCALSG